MTTQKVTDVIVVLLVTMVTLHLEHLQIADRVLALCPLHLISKALIQPYNKCRYLTELDWVKRKKNSQPVPDIVDQTTSTVLYRK